MKLAKIKMSKDVMNALNNGELPMLNMYLSWLKRDGDFFISEFRNEELNFDLILFDYSFNEPESKKFWSIVNNNATRTIVNIIEL